VSKVYAAEAEAECERYAAASVCNLSRCKCTCAKRTSVRRASQRKSGNPSPSSAATQTPSRDHTPTASSPLRKPSPGRTPPSLSLRACTPRTPPHTPAIHRRRGPVVGVAASDPVPVHRRRVHRRGRRLRLRERELVLPVQRVLALALKQRVHKHGVPVVRPRPCPAPVVAETECMHAREGKRAGGGGHKRLRVVGGGSVVYGGRVVYGRVGVPMPKAGRGGRGVIQ
jgi:hypothetical protein